MAVNEAEFDELKDRVAKLEDTIKRNHPALRAAWKQVPIGQAEPPEPVGDRKERLFKVNSDLQKLAYGTRTQESDLMERLGEALIDLFESGAPSCPSASECFRQGQFGWLSYEDPEQNAMGGKPWQECHCASDEQRDAEEAIEEFRKWKEKQQ